MKFLNKSGIFLIFFALISLSCIVRAQEGGDAKRAGPRRPIGKSAKTTTTAAPPEYDGEYPDGDIPEEGEEGDEAVAPSSTTTEPPKKIGPVIRPFRSNDDFLNSLKRRQMDAKKHRAEKVEHRSKPHVEQNDDYEPAPASAPVAAKSPKSSLGGAANRRSKFTKSAKPEPQPEDAAAEGSENEEKEEPKLKRPHPRLTLRKRA